MARILNITLITACLMLLFTSNCFAADLALEWDANPAEEIAGYKVYYQADSANLPFAGYEANEGDSPIDVGNNLNFALSGLSDGRVYYFAVVAYNAVGVESRFSNIVASDWVPELIAPLNGAVDESTVARFIWASAPEGYDVTYTLYYGADPQLGTLVGPANFTLPKRNNPLTAVAMLLLIGLLYSLYRCPRKTVAAGALALTLSISMAGCGGGDSDSANLSVPDALIPPSTLTTVLQKGNADYHEVYDLAPATTYYWKVVAQDVSNPASRYESLTLSFTTKAY